jgi:hypothetical protein
MTLLDFFVLIILIFCFLILSLISYFIYLKFFLKDTSVFLEFKDKIVDIVKKFNKTLLVKVIKDFIKRNIL